MCMIYWMCGNTMRNEDILTKMGIALVERKKKASTMVCPYAMQT